LSGGTHSLPGVDGSGIDGWTGRQRVARKIVGTRLFLISYAPLWAIFAIRTTTTSGQVVFWALAAWGVFDAFRLIEAGLRRSMREVEFDDVLDKSGEVAGYLATYLLPFIGGPPTDTRGWLAYVVYFVVAWAVFVPSPLGLVNPTLYVLGWRLVEATRSGRRTLIICQDPPKPGCPGEAATLMGGVGWVRRPTRLPWLMVARRR
jgi:hypothetical protein